MTARLTTLCFMIAVAALAQAAVAVNVSFRSGPALPEGTIDAAARSADVIVRGTVTSSEGISVDGRQSEAQFTLRVTEVLKGAPAETLVFRAKWGYEFEEPNTDWLKEGGGGDGLFFLVAPETHQNAAGTLRKSLQVFAGQSRRYDYQLWALPLVPLGNRKCARMIDLTGVGMTPERILAATRAALRAEVVSNEPVTIWVPDADNRKSSVEILTPVDARLEAPARLWLGEPSRADTALTVLAYFPSEENAALIAPLLNDRTVSSGSHKWATRTYWLRYRAYQVLKAYGKAAPLPVPTEPTAYRPVHRTLATAGVAVVLLLVGAVPLVRRRFLAAGAALSTGVFLLLLMALVSRGRTVHELVMSAGSDAYEAGSYPDGLRFKRRTEDWPVRVPLSYGQWKADAVGYGWEPAEFQVVQHDRLFGVSTRTGIALCFRRDWSYEFAQLLVPHWLALVACGVLPAAWVVRWLTTSPLRQTARIAKGLCGECGYDVRANKGGRCSECGTPVVSLNPRPA